MALCRDGPENNCLLLAEVARHLAAVEKAVQGVEIDLETVEGYLSNFTTSIKGNLQTEEAVS